MLGQADGDWLDESKVPTVGRYLPYLTLCHPRLAVAVLACYAGVSPVRFSL